MLNETDAVIIHTTEISFTYVLVRAVIFSALSLIIMTSNGFALVVLQHMPELKDATRIFMTSLTVSDICLGLFGLLPVAVNSVVMTQEMGGVPKPHLTLCVVQNATLTLLQYVDLTSVLLINAERYIACVYPLKYPIIVTRKRCLIAVASLLLFWVIWATYAYLILLSNTTPVYDVRYGFCTLYSEANVKWLIIGITCNLLVPLGIVIGIYWKLMKVVKDHEERMAIDLGRGGVNQDRSNRSSNHRALITFLLVTLSIIVGWFPYVIVVIYPTLTDNELPVELVFISQCIMYSIPWVNVLIYYMRNKQFELTAKKMLRKILT